MNRKTKDSVIELSGNLKYQKDVVKNDRCPKCGGALDTGWECNDCGFDAQPIALSPAISRYAPQEKP